jgi:hypothetical protein
MATLLAGKHHDGLLHIVAMTHAGMTADEFNTAGNRVRSNALD